MGLKLFYVIYFAHRNLGQLGDNKVRFLKAALVLVKEPRICTIRTFINSGAVGTWYQRQ